MNEGQPQPGELLGPYRIETLLGEGAMGVVLRAVREPDGERVALKVLRAELARDQVYTQRFLREARVAREVTHPHLVPVLDSGSAAGRHYLAMRFVPGEPLADRLARVGRLPIPEILRLAAELGSGLDALHRCGLVHRDVKPSNVLVDEGGSAVLTDFGLAKGPAYTVLTRPGELLGTVDYLAPEVIRGDAAGSASDIYALGCLVFACLAGAPPFAAPSPLQVTVGHLGEEAADPCAGRNDAPPGLSSAVCSALAKEPGERPSTARAYALRLWRAAH